MLDPVNVSYVLANEVAFCSIPEELQTKIQGTVPDVLSQINGLESELVTQASLVKVSVIYSQICLAKDFMPLTEEAQAKMMGAVDTALEMFTAAKEQPQEEVSAQDSDIPAMFGMKVTKAIDVPETYDFEVEIPVEEEPEEDMQQYLSQVLSGVEEAIYDLVKDMPVSKSVVELMYPTIRSQFDAGELTIGKLLQEQPSLIFIPVV